MNRYSSQPETHGAQRQRRPSHAAIRGIGKLQRQGRDCKTCVSCRTRKVKCDGSRPQCRSCVLLKHDCTYLEDGRMLNRPSRAVVQALEDRVSSLWNIIQSLTVKNSQGKIVDKSAFPSYTQSQHSNKSQGRGNLLGSNPYTWGNEAPGISPTSPTSALITTAGSASDSMHQQQYHPTRVGCHAQVQSSPKSAISLAHVGGLDTQVEDTGPSPSETHVAGAVNNDGDVVVHGVSSIFHSPTLSFLTKGDTSSSERKLQNDVSTARLVANATLQRQHELICLRGPSLNQNIDFDGVDPEMALHLLDLHWNRQRLTYLITYRPAIMDSLINGGPYANKILLNGIYLSSSLLSDRIQLRSNPSDPQSSGDQFYHRFRCLLVDEIDKPSIPTAVGLLLCGATLVSHGRPSAGWVFCGISYRMIIDLGCHFIVDSRCSAKTAKSALLTDLELEMRKRLYWGAYMTDATQSLYFGRPPCLRASQARVPHLLLDTHEELEYWTPYIDPRIQTQSSPLQESRPRPAYAISTFHAMLRLFEISSRLVHTFYNIKSLKYPSEHILKMKRSIESELQNWFNSLPPHLHFDPENDATPPPHQLTPLTTYHTLLILLQRPFLSSGHLRTHFNQVERYKGEQVCINAAFSIWRLVESYKRQFTLRRAPYLISYSVYSAVVAILSQNSTDRSQFSTCMGFFWSALTELQRGSNFGLHKPLEILRDMMNQFGTELSATIAEMENQPKMNSAAQFSGQVLGTFQAAFDLESHHVQQSPLGPEQGGSFSVSEQDLVYECSESADWPVTDALFGLFSPNGLLE